MTRRVLLSASDRFGLAIEERLRAAGAAVVRIDHRDLGEHAAELDGADVLVLGRDDDGGNVDLALTVRRLRPELPLVVRIFDQSLATYLEATLDHVTVLSMSQTVAPVFADATVQAIDTRNHATENRLPSHTPSHPPLGRRVWLVDRVLVGPPIGLLLLVVSATVYFSHHLHLSYFDAFYFVAQTIATVGGTDLMRNAPQDVKVVSVLLMFGGSTFIATLFAFFTEWVVSRRLEVLRGRVRARGRGHILVCGGGHVGFRVVNLLAEKGHRLVVIERDPENRHIGALRLAGHHVIVADATQDEMLELARVGRAAAVLALTDSEATNLHIGLAARARDPSIPIVLRTVSPELSAHMTERRDGIAISPISVAADRFVKAAL